MSKVQDKKNRKKATEKIQVLSFAFQVYWEKKKLMPELPDDDDHLIAERKMIRNYGMVEDFLTLYEIMSGVKADLGIVPEPDKAHFKVCWFRICLVFQVLLLQVWMIPFMH